MMRLMRPLTLVAIAWILVTIACSRPAAPPMVPAVTLPTPKVTLLESPAGAGSMAPWLAGDTNGRALLSWLEPTGNGWHALRLSAWDGSAWAEATTITEGADVLANWADTPTVHAPGGDRLVASWPALQGADSDGYDLRVATSADRGATWSAPFTPHRDATATEHDFPSLFATGSGGLGVAWLDGRAHASGDGTAEQALMVTFVDENGTIGPETVIDPRTCECCPTSAARTDDSVLIAYRDRSADEVRDIALVRWDGAAWSAPRVVHVDGWKVAGCPVNGPSLSADGRHVALAWFTAPEGGPRVSVAFSGDGGQTFGAPVRVDEGQPLGRVEVEWQDDGTALVAWLEREGEAATFRVRTATAEGSLGDSATVAHVEAGRTSGFPRLTRTEKGVLAAWTVKDGETTRVRLALLR